MIVSCHCLDWVVPEGMSQVWRRSEVGNHKRRTLNTRLSSGTSEHTSSRSRNVPGRMIRSDLFWYWNKIKIKPTYRDKKLPDFFFFGGFRSTLKVGFDISRTNAGVCMCTYECRVRRCAHVRLLYCWGYVRTPCHPWTPFCMRGYEHMIYLPTWFHAFPTCIIFWKAYLQIFRKNANAGASAALIAEKMDTARKTANLHTILRTWTQITVTT